jgi:hypothetical protein
VIDSKGLHLQVFESRLVGIIRDACVAASFPEVLVGLSIAEKWVNTGKAS